MPCDPVKVTFAETDNMKLFVAGFPNDFDNTDLKEMFELYGTVQSAGFITDRATGRSKGFGFVEMPNKLEAMQTIEALNGVAMKGKKLSVQKAEERNTSGNFNSRSNFNNRRY